MEEQEFMLWENGPIVTVSTSSNPFGEHYVVMHINGKVVSGVSVEKKKNGVIEVKNKIMSQTIRIGEETPRKLD